MEIGQPLPAIPVQQFEDGAVSQVDLSEIASTQDIVLIAVPGAFTPTCSEMHVPGYLKNEKLFTDKGIGAIVILAPNDFYVVKAWSEHYQPNGMLRFVADGSQKFTKAANQQLDLNQMGLGYRSQRYAAIVRGGIVEHLFVEPDASAVTGSGAEAILSKL